MLSSPELFLFLLFVAMILLNYVLFIVLLYAIMI